MRVQLTDNPFATQPPDPVWGQPRWPARWIQPTGDITRPLVAAFRCAFQTSQRESIRIHVSADERYDLFLNGQRLGCGPEQGDQHHWHFETYQFDVDAGNHMLVARVWALGREQGFAPAANMSVDSGFILAAEGDWNDRLATGHADWQAKRLGGYEFISAFEMDMTHDFIGAAEHIDGRLYDWGFERGEGDEWADVTLGTPGMFAQPPFGQERGVRYLRPATLPAQFVQDVRFAEVCHAESIAEHDNPELLAIDPDNNDATWRQEWIDLVERDEPCTIAADTHMRVLLSLHDYYCGYPELTVTGGDGAEIELHFAESLFESPDRKNHRKDHRDQVEGKYFRGFGDIWRPDGGTHRTFRPLWWRAGVYALVNIKTADKPLRIDRLTMQETRYPLESEMRFDTDDTNLTDMAPMLLRGMQMCSHETYMDCPFYERLMYVGDARLEALTTYALMREDRLPRKAVEVFHWSRRHDGLTTERYPSTDPQVCPTFSLWWVCMLHDLAMWRGERDLVREMMTTARSVGEAFRTYLNDEGLVYAPPGWNFVDWAPQWRRRPMTNDGDTLQLANWHGTPPEGNTGVSGIVNWQFVLALVMKAELEDWFGEASLAERDRKLARELTERLVDRLYVPDRGLLADDLGHMHFSEHSQCLALLTGLLPANMTDAAVEALSSTADLTETTLYFSHYLFEVARITGRMDLLFDRLGLWHDFQGHGLKTPPESGLEARSDCHAWGSHPLFHFSATILGLRPATFGFEQVDIRPQLGPLEFAKGSLVHPRGPIELDVRRDGDNLRGSLSLPEGLTGTLHLPQGDVAIDSTELTF